MKSLLSLLSLLIVIFATNDGLRDTFLQNSVLSYFKEAIVVFMFTLLTISISFSRRRVFCRALTVFNFVLAFLLVTSFITTMLVGFESFLRADALSFGGWSVWIKVLVFVLLTNTLVLLYTTNRSTYDAIPYMYIAGVAFYSILTVLFVSTGLNAKLPMRDWHGRISIGYPPMDSFVLVVGCVFSTFYVKNIWYVALLHLLFVIVLIMQNTVSGYLLLLGYLFCLSFILKGKMKLLPIATVLILLGAMAYIYVYLATNMGDFGKLIIDKINGFIFGNETASITIRQEQINYLLDALKSESILYLFGIGGVGAFAVENQFYSILGMFGLVGVVLFGLLVVYILILSWFRKDYVNCMFLLLYLIGSTSLTGLYLFPLVFVISYSVARFYIGNNHEVLGRLVR